MAALFFFGNSPTLDDQRRGDHVHPGDSMNEQVSALGSRSMPSAKKAAPDREGVLAESREPGTDGRASSLLAEGLIGSPILKIAAEVRALAASGKELCNLTVGDFAPSEFPVPELLSKELIAAVQKG